jgi:hypothetical protein
MLLGRARTAIRAVRNNRTFAIMDRLVPERQGVEPARPDAPAKTKESSVLFSPPSMDFPTEFASVAVRHDCRPLFDFID